MTEGAHGIVTDTAEVGAVLTRQHTQLLGLRPREVKRPAQGSTGSSEGKPRSKPGWHTVLQNASLQVLWVRYTGELPSAQQGRDWASLTPAALVMPGPVGLCFRRGPLSMQGRVWRFSESPAWPRTGHGLGKCLLNETLLFLLGILGDSAVAQGLQIDPLLTRAPTAPCATSVIAHVHPKLGVLQAVSSPKIGPASHSRRGPQLSARLDCSRVSPTSESSLNTSSSVWVEISCLFPT